MLKVYTFIGLLLVSNGYGLDVNELCKGKSKGELVANPLDCGTYYLCANQPILKRCSKGLQFDEFQKNCNWPDQSNCRYGSNSEPNVPVNEVTTTNVTPTQSPPLQEELDLSKLIPNNFGAFSVTTGKQIDPMADYNVQRIECIHYGVYFLPHPRQCDKYFICAFGHLHMHQCGGGMRWSFMDQKCTITFGSQCYLGENSTDSYEIVPVHLPTAVLPQNPIKETLNFSAEQIVSIIPTSSHTEISEISTTTPDNPPKYKKPKCPNDGKKTFIPFPYDCRKYYICFLGIPVLTSCPNGLYWNEMDQACSLTKSSKCNV